MTAKEARELSNSKIENGIQDVLIVIKAHATNGHNSTWYYKRLYMHQKEALKELGYKLSQESFDRNEYLINISW